MSNTKIRRIRKWDQTDVHVTCEAEEYYTCGTNRDYEKMLNMVDSCEPTTENMRIIAQNILDHTDPEKGETLTNIMCILEKFCVHTIFEEKYKLTGKVIIGEEELVKTYI